MHGTATTAVLRMMIDSGTQLDTYFRAWGEACLAASPGEACPEAACPGGAGACPAGAYPSWAGALQEAAGEGIGARVSPVVRTATCMLQCTVPYRQAPKEKAQADHGHTRPDANLLATYEVPLP